MVTLHLFEGYGVEIEYMIVDRTSLQIKPLVPKLLKRAAGEIADHISGVTSWSNEIVAHVLEIKNTAPHFDITDLTSIFAEQIKTINQQLAVDQAMLLPSGSHPFMDPNTQSHIWSHAPEWSPVYEAYHRIFGIHAHGFANVQSVHLNLPFANDEEFEKLHAAIRIILPILPALAASSPILNSQRTSYLDSRLIEIINSHQAIPLACGDFIPESISSADEYYQRILQPLYEQIASQDPDGLLQFEWLNNRAARPMFDRMAIEIRILDPQECPAADIAICEFISAILKTLISMPLSTQISYPTASLTPILWQATQSGLDTPLDTDYLRLLGINSTSTQTIRQALQTLHDRLISEHTLSSASSHYLQNILDHGNLAQRILAAIDSSSSPTIFNDTYHHLGQCLATDSFFNPSDL